MLNGSDKRDSKLGTIGSSKKLIFLIDIAKGKSIVEGEGKSGSDKVEWDSSEIKMTVA